MKGRVFMSIRERVNRKGTVYEVRFQYKNKYGITKNYSKSGFTKKKDAKNHEMYIKEQLRIGNSIETDITLNEVFDEQMLYDTSLADSTKEIRKIYFNKHIKPRIGAAKIILLDYKVIQKMFNELSNEYSKSTNENILRLLNSLFKFAYNCGYINRLPYAKISVKGKIAKKKDKVITHEDFENVIQYTETCQQHQQLRFRSYRIALYIGYYTGMRLSEVCSLDWQNIDFKNNKIHIEKSMYVDKHNIKHLKDTKSEESRNDIPLPLVLKSILIDWKEENISNHVIVDNDGDYLNPKNLKGFLLNFSRKKYHKNISFHMLRHTYSTRLWEHNTDPKIAQSLLRHKDFSTTMNIYTHLDRENLNDVVDNIFKN